VVDEDVEPSVLVDDLLHGPPAIVCRGHVALVDGRLRAGLLELCLERLGLLLIAAVAGRDGRTLVGQAAADRRTDPSGPAGHQRDTILQFLPAYGERLVTSFYGCHCCSLSSLCSNRSSRRATAQ